MKILILTNDFNCKVVNDLKKNKLLDISVSYDYKDISCEFNIVFAHNYDKIIPEKYFSIPILGIFVLHSTDLPKGRGWAPIYYSISNQELIYTITLLKISRKIDEGNIFIKLHIDKPTLITNENLRDIDEDGILLVINKFIQLYKDGYIIKETEGLKQYNKKATYNEKRTPQDNFIDSQETLEKSIFKILATNLNYPSFIELNGEKIYISAKSDKYYVLEELKYSLEVMI